MLIEWLKELLSISWNQRNTKKKQIVMGLTSIKLRQPIEINSGKNARKGFENVLSCFVAYLALDLMFIKSLNKSITFCLDL